MGQTIVYVSCAESREIRVFALDEESGKLWPRQTVVSENGLPLPLSVAADGSILLLGTRNPNGIASYAIDAQSGELTALGVAAAPGGATYVSCDGSRRDAFVASYGGNSLVVFPLAANGVPQAASQILDERPKCHAALLDRTNTWLLAPMLAVDAIAIYRLGEDLEIKENDPPHVRVRSGCGPRHLVFSPDNRFVHCLNELDGSIDVFAFDAAQGTLTPTQSISMLPPSFVGKPWAAELRATLDGRFLYATDRRSSMIAAFAVAPEDGSLHLVAHTPTETQPRGMGISASGRWLLAAGELSNHVSVYAIDAASGELTAVHRQETGVDPICVEMVTL